jgi:glycosyltransferase involved in cell wall biosynthesis/SAM-dependent methyltransferase
MTSPDMAATDRGAAACRFSVVINVYNGADFLRQAIDSVIGQSFTDWELILWDDCSTDGSGDICREYRGRRVRYYRAPANAGIGAARNEAARHATGDWLAFLDQDDIWLPHKLAAQNALIEADQTGELGLVYGRTMRFAPHGRTAPFDPWHGPGRLPEGNLFDRLLRKPSFIAFSSTLIRRDAFAGLGRIPADIVYCPDYYLCVAVARRYRVACVQELCCLYRVHSSSMTHVYRKQILEESLHIIEHFAGPAQRHIARIRRWVHQTLIGVDEMRTPSLRWTGAQRILRQGSLLYLVFRPVALLSRLVRHWLIRPRGKYHQLQLIRSLGMLEPVDRLRLAQKRLLHQRRNAKFVRTHPDFPVPPVDLAFDAYNNVDWTLYSQTGLQHAEVFASIIRREAANRKLSILEWGCGPGRIIRHMRACLTGFPVTLTGSDYNERTVAWCREHLPGMDFVTNGAFPPLPFPDEQFDVVYTFSVFTHLSEEAQIAWAGELERVLKPGGLLICSTHGDHYRHLLTREDEVLRYDQGQVVVQTGYPEGKKWFLAIHPPRFVRERLLGGFEDVQLAEPAADSGMLQDLWVARKTRTASRAGPPNLAVARS